MRPTDLTARGKRAATMVINAPLGALSFGVGLAIGGVRAAVRRLGGPPRVPSVPPPGPSTGAADVGYDPDAGETDLQQPDTEPLLDPGTAKAIRSESEMMRRAADPEPD